jgi:hypothetical protein
MTMAVVLVVLALLVVLLFIILLLYAFARLSGWSRLAAAYPGRDRPAQPRRWFGYGVFRGWIGYNGGLMVGADEGGLDIAGMPFLLAFCHPPIFIPWADVVEIRRRRILWAAFYGIRTRRAPEVDFALRRRTFEVARLQALRAKVPVIED